MVGLGIVTAPRRVHLATVTLAGDIGAHFAAWYLHYLHYLPWIHVMLEWAGPVQPRQ